MPGKFSGLATLPAQDSARSVRELERAVTKLGLKGGFLGTNVNGRYLDDESFMPIYEAAASLKVPIIVHPANPAAMSEMRDYHLFNMIGFTTESANSIARLIFSGVFDRLPDLQFIFLHGGGTAPYLIGRFIHGWEVRPECQNISRSPLEYLREHFYFDALVFHPPVVRFLVDLMGSERIMLGTDLAYDMTDTNIVQTLKSAGLSDEEYANITHLNAQRLFQL
jgi:aminocarboxymuconate-semialdehyde decarboxylase